LCPLLYFNVTKIVRPIITQRMQINAAHQVWPSTKIQLCLWHLKRAVAKRLADSSIAKTNTYNAELAKTVVDFIDLDFHPFSKDRNISVRSAENCDMRFCPKEYRDLIIEKMVYHLLRVPITSQYKWVCGSV